MLTRESARVICLEARRLIASEKFQNSRTLRRFLESLLGNGMVLQNFAFEEGYSLPQLEAIQAYAAQKAQEQYAEAQCLGFEFAGTNFDKDYGLVQNVYKLNVDLQSASLKQLNSAVYLVELLAHTLTVFSESPATQAGFEDYQYRHLPCNISAPGELWEVSGRDVRTGSFGVLEWCFDEKDALQQLAQMKRFPERFIGVKAQRHQEGTGIHPTVAEATN